MEVALAKLDELYSIHDHFFSANKEEKKLKLQALVDEVMALVDDVGMDRSNSRELKATAWYIQGKALEVFPEYNPSSEALLTKAAKLDPCNSDIWVSLGNCFWKKGDLEAAKNCFESCLDYGPSKHALRSLSMVLRKMGTNVEEKTSNIKASITHAKAALNLDIQDGESWYVMGNAYLALFFACSHSTVDLDRSLAAYARAEAGGAANNPDLHFNRANVHRYKEDYALAVQSFCKAHALDPSLRAMAIVDGKMDKSFVAVDKKNSTWQGRFKVTRIAQLASALPPVCEVQGRTRVSISSLQQGHNEGKVVALKLLVDVVRGNEPPGCFVMMDEAQTCCAVSIYHLDSVAYTKMTERDVFYVLDPFVKVVHLEYNCMSINYVCLHVAEPHLFLINGHVVAESYAHAEIHLKNFDL